MEKNKTKKGRRKKRQADILSQSSSFSFRWLRLLYKEGAEKLELRWGLSKKVIPDSVTRNRFKRWGRENIKKTNLKGFLSIVFFKRSKNFYKEMKRKDFDYVFYRGLEKVGSKA